MSKTSDFLTIKETADRLERNAKSGGDARVRPDNVDSSNRTLQIMPQGVGAIYGAAEWEYIARAVAADWGRIVLNAAGLAMADACKAARDAVIEAQAVMELASQPER